MARIERLMAKERQGPIEGSVRTRVWIYLRLAMLDRYEVARSAYWLGHVSALVDILDSMGADTEHARKRMDTVKRICEDCAAKNLWEEGLLKDPVVRRVTTF